MSRERLLDAALGLFAERGYAGTGVDQLAERAGIAKTAIYYHFGNKEGVLAAVVDRAARTWIEGIRQAASQAGDPLARLDRALAGMRALLEESVWTLRLLQILALEVAERKPEVRATLQSLSRRAREALVSGMEEALGVEIPDADAIARVILALLDGVVLALQVEPEGISLDEAFAEIRRIVILMVASRLDPDLARRLEDPRAFAARPQAGGS